VACAGTYISCDHIFEVFSLSFPSSTEETIMLEPFMGGQYYERRLEIYRAAEV